MREPAPSAPAVAPTPLRFSLPAEPNDAWNAVGQILVRTPGVGYDGRSQMIGLYAASEAAAELLALLARELPAEIESVKARFADEKAARASARPQKKRPGRGR